MIIRGGDRKRWRSSCNNDNIDNNDETRRKNGRTVVAAVGMTKISTTTNAQYRQQTIKYPTGQEKGGPDRHDEMGWTKDNYGRPDNEGTTATGMHRGTQKP